LGYYPNLALKKREAHLAMMRISMFSIFNSCVGFFIYKCKFLKGECRPTNKERCHPGACPSAISTTAS